MAIFDFFLSRNNGGSVQTYVGHKDRLFYDSNEKLLRISDGVTPGGKVINSIALISTTTPPNPNNGDLWLNPTNNELLAYYNNAWRGTINVATDTTLGGVKLGPGVITNAQGQIIIDSTGLDFSFGDFGSSVELYSDSTAYALLQTVHTNEDAVIASNGTGKISIVGEFTVHTTNGSITGSLEIDPIFRVSSDGQVRMLVPISDSNEGSIEIVGSLTGETVAPGQLGTMLHITGQREVPARIYIDGNGDYTSFVARRWNGNLTDGRTQVLAGDDVFRINATAQTNAGMPSQAIAQMKFTAIDDQTATTQGSQIEFVITPSGQASSNRVSGLIIKADGIKIPAPSSLTLDGITSGSIRIAPPAIAGTTTINLPATSGTFVTTGDNATVTNTMLAGSIANNKLANSSVTVNGTTIALGASGTVTAAAGTLTGTTLNSTVVTSSLTSVGTLTNLTVTNTIVGSITGNAGTVTNGVYTTGDQTINGAKTFSTQVIAPRIINTAIRTVNGGTALTVDFATDSIILWTAPSGTGTITLSNYTAGATVKVIVAMTTSRDINYGVNAGANSSDGATAFNGSGFGSADVSNRAMHLTYTCVNATAAGCYLQVTVTTE